MSYLGTPAAAAPITEAQAAAAIDARALRKSGAQTLTQPEIDQALANLGLPIATTPEATAGTSNGRLMTALRVAEAIAALQTPWPTGYLSGLTLSRTSTTTFSVAAGVARNEDAGTARNMTLAASITKSLSAWAVGAGNGGLDTGAVAATAWYHVHLIRRDSDGVIDAIYSLSATSPTMPSGWTARRRLGSIRTDGSSQIIAFQQTGDTFLWETPLADVAATNPGTAAVTRTLTVPTGSVVFPIVAWAISNATSGSVPLLVSALSGPDNTPTTSLFTLLAGAANSGASGVVSNIPTNTSAQVRTRLGVSGASDTLRGTTLGWIDPRGKL